MFGEGREGYAGACWLKLAHILMAGSLQIIFTNLSRPRPPLPPKSEQGGMGFDTLLPSSSKRTQAIQLPAKSHCGSAWVWRVARVGILLILLLAILIAACISTLLNAWSAFGGPPEKVDDIFAKYHKDLRCEENLRWSQSSVVEPNDRWLSRSNFTVPLTEEFTLQISAEGGVPGSVNVVGDDTLVNEVYFHLDVEYDHPKTFGKTRFCVLDNTQASGLKISGPRSSGKGEEMTTGITVYVPKSAVPNFHRVFVIAPEMEVNFAPNFQFQSKFLGVESKSTPSYFSNIQCEYCSLKVSDESINGNFSAGNTMVLKTKSGAIDANITMVSKNIPGIPCSSAARQRREAIRPVVDIATATGPINANFALIAIDPDTGKEVPHGGTYLITARSIRAPVRLEIVDAPVDSLLELFAKNMMGPLKVYLHSTYQGYFSTETFIINTPAVGFTGYVDNPSGSDRKRNVIFDGWRIPPGINQIMFGQVWWGDRPHLPESDKVFGTVNLRSLLGSTVVYMQNSIRPSLQTFTSACDHDD